MVTKVGDTVEKKHHRGGEAPKRHRRKVEKSIKKRREGEEEDEEEDAETGDEGSLNEEEQQQQPVDADHGEPTVADEEVCDEAEDGTKKCRKRRHIHPCLCDVPARIKQKIDDFLKYKAYMYEKHDKRVKEIEKELARIEEARLEAEREAQEQEELFGDEYEVVGKKKKRKKRSARRASMVSLGVKQVINWKKQPRLPVKFNMASELRTRFKSYCGMRLYPLTPIQEINYRKAPNLEVRTTLTSTSRLKKNINKRDELIKNEDKKVPFVIPHYV